VTRINISVNDQKFRGSNDCNLHAVYSDTLNKWILRALSTKEKYRITSDQLVKHIIPVDKEMIQGFAGKVGLIDLEISCEDREESDDEEDTEADKDEGRSETDNEVETDIDNDYSP